MINRNTNNIQWHASLLTNEKRWQHLGCRGCTVWLTGLPASGKSTVATVFEQVLVKRGIHAYRLDGDNLRHGLNKGLGFSREDRAENIRRVGEIAKLFAESGCVTITAFISPYAQDREKARDIHKQAQVPFFEVFVDAPLDLCEKRDPKGQYQKARAGLIQDFTGVDDPYQIPEAPELILKTGDWNVETCVEKLIELLVQKEII